MHDPLRLPADLPVPLDDGAADHLVGMDLPPVELPATDGAPPRLRERRVVVFAYPRTGVPGGGAARRRGVLERDSGRAGVHTQACAVRDLHSEFVAAGARVFGLSTQGTDYQREAAERLHLPYPLLSDAKLELTHRLRLPTFEVERQVLLRRLTLLLRDGRVTDVHYPVFPPDGSDAEALRRLTPRD